MNSELPRWCIAQIGAREHYALARAAAADARLSTLFTDLWAPRWLRSVTKPAALARIAARRHDQIPDDCVRCQGFAATLAEACGHQLHGRRGYERFLANGRRFGAWLAGGLGAVGGGPSQALFAYSSAALEGLEEAARRGMTSVVGQIDPALSEYELVCAEANDWPGWCTQPPRVPAAYWERLQAEWDAAGIVAVNSAWSRDALQEQGVPAAKLAVIPLAFDAHARACQGEAAREWWPWNSARPTAGGQGPRALRVLFLGQVILRKGVHYLLQAAARLEREPVEFVIAGPLGIARQRVRDAPANVLFTGALPRPRTAALYAAADLFVLPTLSDGFALTQLEAMAHGVPVVATPRCGEVVQDGVNGWLVPPRDVDALVAAVSRALADRPGLEMLSAAARSRALDFELQAPLRALDTLWLRERAGPASTGRQA